MKKRIILLLAFILMISGCLTWAPVSPDEELPWYGITDPNFINRNRD